MTSTEIINKALTQILDDKDFDIPDELVVGYGNPAIMFGMPLQDKCLTEMLRE